jgi:PKD repeat protein
MKKLLTLALVLLMGAGLSNAQNCEFTYSLDSETGVLTLNGPSNISPAMGMFIWTFENGVFLNGYNASYTFNQNGTEVVTLSIYANQPDSALICSSSQVINVVLDNPQPTCSIIVEPDANDPYTFLFSIPGADYEPSWTFGNITTTGFQTTYTFDGPGVYSVCADVTGGGFTCNDCIDVYVLGDTLNPWEPTCDASFYASAGPLTGFFIPTANGSFDPMTGEGAEYFWDFGDGNTSSEMYPYHVYETAGTYTVCLAVSLEGICSDSLCQSVIIPEEVVFPNDSLCSAYFVVSQENPFEINVVNASTVNAGEFTWTISGGGISITATGAYPSIQVETLGSFELCLTVTGPNGCTSTYCDSIVVDENGFSGGRLSSEGFVINVSSPAGITGFVSTGIAPSVTASEFSVYPNPFSDLLNIAGEDGKAYQIFSVDGKLVLQGNINANQTSIAGAELKAGIYFLNILRKDGSQSVTKISKK